LTRELDFRFDLSRKENGDGIQRATHATIVLERNFSAPPERVFAAFSDPRRSGNGLRKARDSGSIPTNWTFVWAGKKSLACTFADFPACTNDTYFLVIVPNRRIVIAYTMTMNGQAFSSSQSTFEFTATESGTTMLFTEQAAFFRKVRWGEDARGRLAAVVRRSARTLAN